MLRRRRLWRDLIGRTLRASTTDRLSLAAAGCAFYATLALFPAISMLTSIYGLLFNPVDAEQQLIVLSGLVPPQGYELIADRMHQLVSQPNNMLSASLIISFVLTFWSSSIGSRSVLSAVNVAYNVAGQRPFFRSQLIGLAMTLAAILSAVLAIGVLVLLPVAIDALGLMRHGGFLVHLAGLAMLIGLFFVSASLLYRYGPCRAEPSRCSVRAGAILATVMWVVASELLAFYASRMSSFGSTYGPLGAVVAIMLWFYVSAYAVLLGAELNAQLEEAHGA